MWVPSQVVLPLLFRLFIETVRRCNHIPPPTEEVTTFHTYIPQKMLPQTLPIHLTTQNANHSKCQCFFYKALSFYNVAIESSRMGILEIKIWCWCFRLVLVIQFLVNIYFETCSMFNRPYFLDLHFSFKVLM